MTELNLNVDRNHSIEYVIARITEAESGDADAIRYIEFLWDHDEELLYEAREELFKESGL